MNKQIEIASKLQIKDQVSMSKAVELLSQLNKILDDMTEEREKLTKPINEALKEIRGRYKPTEVKLTEAISKIRQEMSIYQTALLKEQQEAEKKISDRLSDGKISVSTAMKKIEALEGVDTKVMTDSGSVKFRTSYQVEIIDESKIPRKYLTVNEKLLLDDLKSGKNIPGVSLGQSQTPINHR